MHPRHRNQGHGLKANSVGLGPASSGNSEYRSFSSRGYGRGHMTRYKSFQQVHHSSQKSDIFMEAGKLATEYLVSRGSLSPSSLPTKWKTGSFNKQSGGYPDEPFQESRSSVHSRLGNNNGGLDSRRRYSYDFTRHQPRARRRGDPYRNHPSEWSKDHESNGPDRTRVSSDLEVEDDSVSDLDNFDSSGKLTPALAEKKSEELSKIDSQPGEIFVPREAAYLKEIMDSEENENEKLEGNLTDLTTLCRFLKVPTKTRSALISKSSNSEEVEVDIKDQVPQNPGNEHSTSETITEDVEGALEKPIENPSDANNLKPENVVQKFARSESCPSKTCLEETNPAFERNNSLKERGEKRKLSSADLSELVEKQREWLTPFRKAEDEAIHQNAIDDGKIVPQSPILESLVENYDFTNSSIQGSPKSSEEKQLFPSSFKICDLNLNESSNTNDIHCGFTPISSVKDEELSVGIDLSMNSTMPAEYAKSGKEIEVIDLDSDLSPDKEHDEKVESGYEESAERVSMKSNYDGMMMSELLHDVEPRGDDDDESIYISLEEIPLSYVPPWQQPTTQHYDKPF